MTEIPEHLLARSRARREAAGLAQPGEAAAPAPAAGGEVEQASATTPATAPATTPAVPAAPAPPPPPKPDPPYIQAYKERKKIPWWALPAVASLPVWAFIYIYTLETPGAGADDPATLGAQIYGQCAACHGAGGAGAAGPALDASGDLAQVFPSYKDHITWVELGSAGTEGGTYGATRKPIQGGMPAWADTLTPGEIVLVVRYEREVLHGMEPDPELVALSELAAKGEDITPYLDGTEPIPPPEAG